MVIDMSFNSINSFPFSMFGMIWGLKGSTARGSDARSEKVAAVACDAFPSQGEEASSVMNERIMTFIRNHSWSLLGYLRVLSQGNPAISPRGLLKSPDSGDISDLMSDELTPENIDLLMGEWEIMGEDEETEKRQDEFLELRKSICRVLNEIKNDSFTEEFLLRFYDMSERISEYNEKYGDLPVIIKNNFVRFVFNEVLKRDRLLVHQGINLFIRQNENKDTKDAQEELINKTLQKYSGDSDREGVVRDWVQKYQGTKIVKETFGRTNIWASNNPIILGDESDDVVKAALFHKELSGFYEDKGVSDSEEFVHSLMVRMLSEYSIASIFAQISSFDEDCCFLAPSRSTEGCGFYFDFKEGLAIVSHKTRHEKKDMSGEEDPQIYEVTRMTSFDPNNILTVWNENVSIVKLT